MAADMALLESAGLRGRPVLRTYSWNIPCATYGYFQSYETVAALTPLRPLVRRPSGGGLVPHGNGNDWTYSLIMPPAHPWHRLRAQPSYRQLHHWIQATLQDLGVATELAPPGLASASGCCFAGAEPDDLITPAGKIAGAAQRRNKLGLLIQGSIQPAPSGIDSKAVSAGLRAAASRLWKVRWTPLPDAEFPASRARELAAQPFAAPRGHAPPA